MNPVSGTNNNTWLAQKWPSNPSLNLLCSAKYFTNPFNSRKVPVFIHGGTAEYPGFDFTVSAGNNSEFSYTGYCVDCYNIESAENYVDTEYAKNNLFR